MAAAGGIPNAVLKHPDELTAEQSADLQAQWVQARMSSLGLPAVLSGGIDFEDVAVHPERHGARRARPAGTSPASPSCSVCHRS